MLVAIDFGITNTDIIVYKESKNQFFSLPSEEINEDFIINIFNYIDVKINEVKKIAVTGGKSSDLDDNFKEIPLIEVNEVQAIGFGAQEIYGIKDESFLVTSAGTGTACVAFFNEQFNHLGGISVGGGTLKGLSNLIIKNNSAEEIDNLAIQGNRNNLDALIGEVVNDIGALHPEITASNFSKAAQITNQSDKDIAASISNMVGEVIGTISYLNALLIGVDKVYFVGRMSLLQSVKDGIDKRLNLAKIHGVYESKREYANALGALAYLRANP